MGKQKKFAIIKMHLLSANYSGESPPEDKMSKWSNMQPYLAGDKTRYTWDVSHVTKNTHEKGQKLLSPYFMLHGVSGLRLWWYPFGESSSKDGTGSLFLASNSGWKIKANL